MYFEFRLLNLSSAFPDAGCFTKLSGIRWPSGIPLMNKTLKTRDITKKKVFTLVIKEFLCHKVSQTPEWFYQLKFATSSMIYRHYLECCWHLWEKEETPASKENTNLDGKTVLKQRQQSEKLFHPIKPWTWCSGGFYPWVWWVCSSAGCPDERSSFPRRFESLWPSRPSHPWRPPHFSPETWHNTNQMNQHCSRKRLVSAI